MGILLLIFVLVIVVLLLPIVALIDIVRNDFKGSNDKIMWVIIVLMLPLIGSLFYFIVGSKQKT